MIGKEIRLKRLMPTEDGKYFGLTVDHAMGRGVMKGLDTIDDTIAKMVAGGPNAITMHKGIAEHCFAPYAGKTCLVLKLTTFGVYHYESDVQVASVEEAIAMGADAVSWAASWAVTIRSSRSPCWAASARKLTATGCPSSAISIPAATISPGTTSVAWRT